MTGGAAETQCKFANGHCWHTRHGTLADFPESEYDTDTGAEREAYCCLCDARAIERLPF